MKPTTTPFPATLTSSVTNLRAALMRLSTIEETKRAEKLSKLPAHWVNHLSRDFPSLAHKHQLAPERANSGADWTTWLILGGRGAGKTRAGAELSLIHISEPTRQAEISY